MKRKFVYTYTNGAHHKKNKRMKRILILCVTLLFAYAANAAAAKKTVISGKILNFKGSTISLNYQEYALLSSLQKEEVDVDEHGAFRVEISISGPARAFLVFGSTPVEEKFTLTLGSGIDTAMTTNTNRSEMVYLYLQSGDKQVVQVTVGDVQQTLQISGRHHADSEYLNQEDWQFNRYADKHLKNYFGYVQYDPTQYGAYVAKREEARNNFLQAYHKKSKLSKHLKDVSEWTIYGDAIMAQLLYPSMRVSYRKDEFQPDPTYYDFLKHVRVNDSRMDKGIAYFYFLDYYLKEAFKLSADPGDRFDFAAKKLSDRSLYEYYAFALRTNFKKKLYEKFDSSCPYPDLAKVVKDKYQHLEGMLEGNPAPAISMQDTVGAKYTFEKWKGKYIYIDFWATWCGPCIQEIPFLKELEHDYAGKNIVFVSMSMDRVADRQKWVDFVRDQKLTGEQVWLDANDNKAISKAFNILQIPRFVLLDKEGRILDVNAPRPSDERLRSILDKLD